MTAAPMQWRIGFVGYGEVSRVLAEDLRKRGLKEIFAFDIKIGTGAEVPLLEHAAQHGV